MAPVSVYPVLPDGCVDILFTRERSVRPRSEAVGTMTRPYEFALPAGRFVFGVRFRPAMARGMLRLPISELTDRSIPLDALWGNTARRLEEQLAEARSVGQAIARLEAHFASRLSDLPRTGPVERATEWLVASRGAAAVEEVAQNAGVSTRQFRRRCLDSSGLTPKRLARVLRFRHAVALVQPGRLVDWANLALECGFYDQAHLINEFREMAGAPPTAVLQRS